MMVTRVALMGIIVENLDSTEQLNAILHRYSGYILGRMGIPYRDREINVISIALDAPQDVTNTLAGEIGALPGVNVKTAFSHVISKALHVRDPPGGKRRNPYEKIYCLRSGGHACSFGMLRSGNKRQKHIFNGYECYFTGCITA